MVSWFSPADCKYCFLSNLLRVLLWSISLIQIMLFLDVRCIDLPVIENCLILLRILFSWWMTSCFSSLIATYQTAKPLWFYLCFCLCFSMDPTKSGDKDWAIIWYYLFCCSLSERNLIKKKTAQCCSRDHLPNEFHVFYFGHIPHCLLIQLSIPSKHCRLSYQLLKNWIQKVKKKSEKMDIANRNFQL